MKIFTEKIYYIDKEVLATIASDFDFIRQCGWYELYRCKIDKTYWRLDKPDKNQIQYFVLLDNLDDWTNYDSSKLQIELLLKTRGKSETKCKWLACKRISLKGLYFCEVHAYQEMGIRK